MLAVTVPAVHARVPIAQRGNELDVRKPVAARGNAPLLGVYRALPSGQCIETPILPVLAAVPQEGHREEAGRLKRLHRTEADAHSRAARAAAAGSAAAVSGLVLRLRGCAVPPLLQRAGAPRPVSRVRRAALLRGAVLPRARRRPPP